MLRPVPGIHRFYSGRSAHMRVSMLSALMLANLLVCALLSLLLSSIVLSGYTHDFTPYLKWQDALVTLLWFVAFIALGGSVFVARFLYALYCGSKKGMLVLEKGAFLIVRDLAAENLASIFWMMNSAFWCFVAVLAGLLPLMLLGWTVHLSHPALAIIATGAVGVISLGGLAVSIVAGSFIVVGCIGVVSFCRGLGGAHVYPLTGQVALRIDNCVLAITCSGMPESMADLKLLEEDDARQFLSLLHEYWIEAGHAWNPALDKEIDGALDEMQHRTVFTGARRSAPIKTQVAVKLKRNYLCWNKMRTTCVICSEKLSLLLPDIRSEIVKKVLTSLRRSCILTTCQRMYTCYRALWRVHDAENEQEKRHLTAAHHSPQETATR